MTDPDFQPILRLTEREYEVFCLAGHGLCMKEIATTLGLHRGTVGVHYDHLRERLNLDSYLQVATYAARYLALGLTRKPIPNRPIIRKRIKNRPLRFKFVPRQSVSTLKAA